MEPHDDKTRFFEKMDKVLKGVIVLTCLTGVIAVAWLCTAGKAKAQETAKVTPETAAADTEPAAESALWETEAEVPAEIPEATPEPEAISVTYVLNKNTHKFHYPDCDSVHDMKAKNRQDVDWSRDEVIAAGYVPCKRCNP